MRWPVVLGALTLGACSLEPADVRPALPVPPSWPVGDAYLRSSEAALPAISYRHIFRDARLQRVIEQALANNRDLRIAAGNIAIARAQYRIQRSDLYPQVTTGGGARFGESATGTTGSTGTGNGTGTGVVTTGGGGFRDSYAVDLGVTAFEIDLFGRVRSLTRAALDQYFATEAAARSTRLALVGDVANAWLSYAADRSLFLIAQETVRSAGRSVDLTRARLRGGVSPRTELRQAESVLFQAEADLAAARNALAQDVNLLQLLVGTPVEPALLPATIEEVLPTLAELPAGLDSGVLLRRPDIVQAEYQLRAENARIGAARAALFPRISLTAIAGLASGALGGLFDGDAFSYSVSPNLDYSLFDAGAGRAGVAGQRARREVALSQYELAIQTGFREVSDALARRGTIGVQEGAVRRQVDAAADNFRLADARYRGGIDTFLQSLDSQRTLYAAQRRLVTTQLERGTNLVTLYRTLGGDATLDARATGPVPLSPEPTGTPVPR